jgi:hypothetical protein
MSEFDLIRRRLTGLGASRMTSSSMSATIARCFVWTPARNWR